MPVTFKFEEVETVLFSKLRRPVAEVFFKHKNQNIWQPVTMVVDTGADYTLLPYYLASALGIDLLRDCKTIETQGVGGTSKGYLVKHKVKVRLGHFEKKVPLAFLPTNKIPPLLGRHEFFETFKVTFEKFTVTFE